MNWLVTGGAGFIGRNLIASLLHEGGHAVRILDNLTTGTRDDLAKVCRFSETGPSGVSAFPTSGEVELVPGDILDETAVERAFANADCVVHLAANTGVGPSVKNPKWDCQANVVGTVNCLEGARHAGVRRFVFASSGAPAGEAQPPIHEAVVPRPISPYGASKMAGEGYCCAYHNCFAVPTVCLRFSNVYGPYSGHKSSVVASFLSRALKGQPMEVFGDGGQTRDFLYIDDLVEAVKQSATKDQAAGETFQIATGEETTVLHLAKLLRDALAAAGVSDVSVAHGEVRQGDMLRNFADTSKARRVLGWKPMVGLEDGLARTVAWFVGQGGERRGSD